jgi:hypothetical protein
MNNVTEALAWIHQKFIEKRISKITIKECEGWDSNPWTPSGPDLKSGAVGQA